MSYNKLPKEKLKSLLLFYPIFLSVVFWISGQLDIRRVAIVVAVYILSAALNIKNLNFLLDRVRLFRILMVGIGIKLKRRVIFLFIGFLILVMINGRVNFLYQIIYIAVFISTDTYISYLGGRYRQLFGKE
jgi:hypothetical protein